MYKFGDLYYKEESDVEKVLREQIVILPEGTIKNHDDVARFFEKHMV